VTRNTRTMSPDQRARISAATKAAMQDPAVRARISERTKAGMQAASGQLAELRPLRAAWQRSAPGTRTRFLNEILAPVCTASAPNDADSGGADASEKT
jgi:hypothetical protein